MTAGDHGFLTQLYPTSL